MRCRTAAVFVVAAFAALVACGDPTQQASTRDSAGGDAPATTPQSAPTTTSAEPADNPIRWNGFGAGTWQGARTVRGGNDVLVVIVGGPEFDPDNPCSIAYHSRVTETATKVRVELGQSSPPDHRPPPPLLLQTLGNDVG